MSGDSEEEAQKLVDYMFDGDATAAMLTIARLNGIAVYYFDRERFEALLYRPLTEAEWERLKPHTEGFAEWLSNSGARESVDYWQSMVLQRAGIDDEGEEMS